MDLFKRTALDLQKRQQQQQQQSSSLEEEDDGSSYMYEKIAFCYIYPLDVKESNGVVTMPITSRTGKLVARIKGSTDSHCQTLYHPGVETC